MQQEAKPVGPIPERDAAVERLRNLKVISHHFLRTGIASLPILVVLLLLADWLIGSRAFAGDLFRLSGVLTIAIEFIVLGQLFRNLPEAFESIWSRDLLWYSRDSEQREKEFV